MTSSVKFTGKVVSKGGVFLATSPEFPAAKGYGPTKEHALDALGQSVRKLLESCLTVGPLDKHPIGPTIREWLEAAPSPVVPFFPESEFMAGIGSLPDFVKEMTIETYKNAALLGAALVGRDYDIGIHEALYRAAEHRLGLVLGKAARLASCSTLDFAMFSASTQLDGFLVALKAWEAAIWPQGEPDLNETASWVRRNLSGQDESAAAFFIHGLLAQSGDSGSFFTAMANSENSEARRLQRRKKGVTQKDHNSKYKEEIKHSWVPAGLWCLSGNEILALLEPDKKKQLDADLKRVIEDIRDLGFKESWKPDHEEAGKKAGSRFGEIR